jgi:diacylglycerol kinase family enzyme
VPALAAWLRAEAPGARLVAAGGIDAASAAIGAAPPRTRVVIVGGDGTLHALLPALAARAGEGLGFGLVALGSGNDVARALGVHRLRWREALHLALHGAAAPMDLGGAWLDGEAERELPSPPRLFAGSLAAGFDGAVACRAARSPGWLRGQPRYVVATLAELAALKRVSIRVARLGGGAGDARRAWHDGTAVFASVLNAPTYGSGMPVVPAARVDDGALDAVVAGRFGRVGVLAMLPRLLAGRHLPHPRIAVAAAAGFAFEAGAPVALAGDGEPWPAARRWRVQVRPAAIHAVRASS